MSEREEPSRHFVAISIKIEIADDAPYLIAPTHMRRQSCGKWNEVAQASKLTDRTSSARCPYCAVRRHSGIDCQRRTVWRRRGVRAVRLNNVKQKYAVPVHINILKRKKQIKKQFIYNQFIQRPTLLIMAMIRGEK